MIRPELPFDASANRILVIAAEPPWPAINGVRTKIAGFVKHLGSEVDVISPAGDPKLMPSHGSTWSILAGRASRTARIRALTKGYLPIAACLPTNEILHLTRGLIDRGGQYGIIHLDTLATTHLAGPLRLLFSRRRQRPVIVASLNDSYSLLLASGGLNDRLRPQLYSHYVRGVERRLLPHADWVDVVSEADLTWLAGVAPGARTRLVPLGVDTAAFAGPRLLPQWDLLYLGTMCAPAFYWLKSALDATLPRLRLHSPTASIAVAGPDATVEAIEYFKRNGVVHLGFVDNLSALLRSAKLLLVSSRQRSGTPTKALQAMAAATPVVGMEALDGIPGGEDKVSFSRATGWADLADRVVSILSDPQHSSRLAHGGRQLIDREHDWQVVRQRYMNFSGSTLPGRPC